MGISFKMGKGSVCGVYTSLKPMIHFDSKQSQSIFNQNYYKNAMANNCKRCSIRIISHTTTPLPKSYDCVAVYIAGRRTSLVVYGWWPQPPTKNCQALLWTGHEMHCTHVTHPIQTLPPQTHCCWNQLSYWRAMLWYQAFVWPTTRKSRGARPLDPLSLNVIDPLERSFVVAGICASHRTHVTRCTQVTHCTHCTQCTQLTHCTSSRGARPPRPTVT